MSFKSEMDIFFMRNCYFQKERERVEASPAYRRAEEMKDATQAQEIAARILEGRPLDS
jgi:hypothetical protein